MTAMALYARFLESFVIVHGNGELPEEDWVFFSSFLPIEGPLLIKIKCLKDMGNDFFRQNLFESAGGCYDMACRLLCYTLKTMDDFDIESVVELAIYLNLNLAACANKLQEYEAAKKCCSLVLSSFPKNAKALFRRALAFMKTNMLLEAQSDLEIASMLEPKNKDILREMKVVKNLRSINPNGKRSIDDHLLLEVVRDCKRPIPVLENIGDNFVEDDGGSSGCSSVSSPPDSITKDTCNSYDGLAKNPKDKFSPNMDLDQHCKEYQESASIKMFQFSKKGGGSSVLRIDARVSMASSGDVSHRIPEDVILQFRAGKMSFEGKLVTPDSRKGFVHITRGEDGLTHFQWLDRVTHVVEDDQIVFPQEAVFEKVEQAPGRVYILKFNTDDRKLFFWLQEPKADGDQSLCHAVNYLLNQPLDLPAEEVSGASVPLQTDEMVEDDISSSVFWEYSAFRPAISLDLVMQSILLSFRLFLRAGNLIGPSMGADMVSDVTSAPGPVKLSDLQRILSNIQSAGPVGDVEDPEGGFGLGDLLKPDLLGPVLETLPIEERLASYLPEGQCTQHDLIEVLQCPPFRQQVDAFTYVLKTGQIDLAQFGIDPSKYKFTVLSFLEALEDSVFRDLECNVLTPGTRDPMDEGQ
ncbi:hypothetical protein KSS87_020600 [Heliosperma pusillum]|nr:hypothetical protein KSS87_020600 [Heliosperma pusillum]